MSDKARLGALIAANRWQDAEALCTDILAHGCRDTELLMQCAAVHAQGGKLQEVADCCERILQTAPAHVGARYNLAVALHRLGHLGRAIAVYRDLLRLAPNHGGAASNLCLLLRDKGRLDEARQVGEQAVRAQPGLAAAHNNLGLVLLDLDEPDRALPRFETAIRMDAGHIEAMNNLALAHIRLRRPDRALPWLQTVLTHHPAMLETRHRLAEVLADLDRCDEALDILQETLTLAPDHARTHGHIANLHVRRGELPEALAAHARAVALDPEDPYLHWNRSWALLLDGDFERGWVAYEWRVRCRIAPDAPHSQPAWQGEPLTGRTLLLEPEQGIGDCIQFIRYAALLKTRGARVHLRCPPPLLRLFSTCTALDGLTAEGAGTAPPFDTYCLLGGLPLRFNTRLDTIPADVPYLQAPAPGSALRTALDRDTNGYRIGICWSGNPQFRYNHLRRCPIGDFAAIATLPGVTCYSLQKGSPAEETAQAAFPLHDLAPMLDDFADTAAAIAAMDLVVTVDTSIAHLAGALGKDCWVLLSTMPDWRWLRDREDSPWYPSLRLFRQRRTGDWDEVFQRVRDALERRMR